MYNAQKICYWKLNILILLFFDNDTKITILLCCAKSLTAFCSILLDTLSASLPVPLFKTCNYLTKISKDEQEVTKPERKHDTAIAERSRWIKEMLSEARNSQE